MKNYSIVRIGNEYVVQADEKSVLKVASRRRAARLVSDAEELLDAQRPRHCRRKAAGRSHQSRVIRRVMPDPPRSSLTIPADSLIHRGGTPPPNGRLAIWKDRS